MATRGDSKSAPVPEITATGEPWHYSDRKGPWPWGTALLFAGLLLVVGGPGLWAFGRLVGWW